jgi:hypothetical protein
MTTRLIVERRFERPLGEQELQANMARLGPCLAAHGVRWIHSHLSAARTRMICEYEASDAESVRLANREAGMGFDDVWVASLHEP